MFWKQRARRGGNPPTWGPRGIALQKRRFSKKDENMLSQESQKMYLECRVASNPSVLVFGRLNQAPVRNSRFNG